LFYYDSVLARILSALALIYCATQLAYRAGVYYGFARGYQEGHEQGVYVDPLFRVTRARETRQRPAERAL
jgi:hypothetical protein